MNAKRYTLQIVKGALLGVCFGVAAFAADQQAARILEIIIAPVSLLVWIVKHLFMLSDKGTAGWFLLFYFTYWLLLGGLVGWGIAVVKAKLTGDE
jgi:hypothetical protein